MSATSAVGAAALEVSGLSIGLTASPVDIVTDVDLTVPAGDVLGLVGETGSGKTTLALALLGYVRKGATIRAGSVRLDGDEVLGRSAQHLVDLRGRVAAYVPQDPPSALNPALRIETQLRELLDAHHYGATEAERRARMLEVLKETSLPADRAFLRRYPHQLSGGQQQRVCLAMAFACRPRVVVLDEPTTGLDVTTQAHVLKTVRRLCEEHGTAAVYVTHDLAVVGAVADRTAVMYAGRLVEVGPTQDLLHRPAHPYTRRLVQAIPDPRLRRELVGIPGRVAPLGKRPTGCQFATRCELAEDACRQEISLVDVGPGHEARCRRVEVVRAQAPPLEGDGLAVPTRVGDEQCLGVRGLTAHYGEHQVLHAVDLAIARGSCLALVGTSGSGKTTLARTIAGLHAAAGGVIALGDRELPFGARARPAELRRRIQYVFQNPYASLNPRKTIGDLIEQPLRVFDGARRKDLGTRVAELLRQVSLDESFAQRYPSQLSGGERQRVAIARALAAEPELLVCDEVTSALDVSVQASVLQLLVRLQRERNLTLLFVTHNLGVVRGIADAVAVMREGRIVAYGQCEQVLDRPTDDHTRRLLADTPSIVGPAPHEVAPS